MSDGTVCFGLIPSVRCFIHSSDNPSNLPWSIQGDEFESSAINIQGQSKVDESLRRSQTSKNRYNCYGLPDLNLFFQNMVIGEGKKHLYNKGDFMKPHYDLRLSDKKQGNRVLPHTMTLIVCNDISSLRVNGKEVNVLTKYDLNLDYSFGSREYIVLFSLNCKHEVLPVENTRISYTFPVYGVFDVQGIPKKIQEKGRYIHDLILERLDTLSPNESHDNLSCIQALIDVLNEEDISRLFVQYRLLVKDDISDNYMHGLTTNDNDNVVVEYNDENGRHVVHIRDMKERLVIGNVTNLIIQPARPEQLVDNMKNLVLKHKQNVDLQYEEKKSEHISVPAETELPSETRLYAIMLYGRYFHDSTVNDLITTDKEIYDFACKQERKVQFVSSACISDDSITCYIYENGKFYVTNPRQHDSYGQYTSTDPEFNDNGEYDPRNRLVHGFLLVLPKMS